jgi:hypothetical protein
MEAPMKILVIPDTQIRPGDDLEFLACIGRMIVAEKPDAVVCIGDFADMPSLSSYDKGKKSFEGRRYRADVESVHRGMEALLGPLREYNLRRLASKHGIYRPRLVLTMGNHEDRINRAINNDPMLDGTISTDDLRYREFGWEVYDFLEVVVIEAVAFSHYFTTGTMGRPASTAQAQLNKKHMSCIAGHQQGRQAASAYRADGRRITSIIAGSCYEHEEGYLGPQGNKHWHGVLMLHNVEDGHFDEHFIALSDVKLQYAA